MHNASCLLRHRFSNVFSVFLATNGGQKVTDKQGSNSEHKTQQAFLKNAGNS